jgi:hypothetical protein
VAASDLQSLWAAVAHRVNGLYLKKKFRLSPALEVEVTWFF